MKFDMMAPELLTNQMQGGLVAGRVPNTASMELNHSGIVPLPSPDLFSLSFTLRYPTRSRLTLPRTFSQVLAAHPSSTREVLTLFRSSFAD